MSLATIAEGSRVAPKPASRIEFLDNLRYLMIVIVVLYHAVAAYARTVAPYWAVQDTGAQAADVARELGDVFMMPILFLIAGYFALPSLRKRGGLVFMKDKAVRLLAPWALLVFIFIPLAVYDRPDQLLRPFRTYWLSYLGSFGTQLSVLSGPQHQTAYWFISLLFTFFALFTLAYLAYLGARRRATATPAFATPKVGLSVPAALALFGIATSAIYFVSLLLFPDMSWFSLSAFLEFQPTRVLLYAAYFGLGIYAQSRGWLTSGKPLGSLVPWGVATAALAVAFVVAEQPLLADAAGTPGLPVLLLLVFALVRSFLLLSLTVFLMSVGQRFWNRSSGLDRQLSATSYNVYLVHLWIVIALQEALLQWSGGPLLAKVAIVFAVALSLSFAISRWVIGRYPRAVAGALLALFVFCLVVRP